MNIKNRFNTLLKISSELNTLRNPAEILDRVMDLAIETIMAERGFVIVKSDLENEKYNVVVARKFKQDVIEQQLQLSNSVIQRVLSSGKSVMTYDAVQDDRFKNADSIQLQNIHSIACVPLKQDKQILGAVYVDNPKNVGRFNNESLEFLEIFAGQATIAIENARIIENLKIENLQLQKTAGQKSRYAQIIGSSDKIQEIFDLIDRVAQSEATVLIQGESGTGKELVAQAIHENSARCDNQFIPIYCGSLSENLLESELFGHKKGAFTGAVENKPGLFEEANNGTIFLDEIADISKNIQTKLLRVLQNGELKRVGDTKSHNVNVRVIAATNKDLWKAVSENEFREDLYYRLNVINMTIPPLRNRTDDIEVLAHHFLRIYADKNKKYLKGISKKAIRRLQAYKWPGNIRELENTIERAVIMSRSTVIEPQDLHLHERSKGFSAGMKLKDIEREIVLRTLQECDGNRTKTSKILGVSRRWLQYHLKEWNVQ
jgi:Nif-specific regulatory protein